MNRDRILEILFPRQQDGHSNVVQSTSTTKDESLEMKKVSTKETDGRRQDRDNTASSSKGTMCAICIESIGSSQRISGPCAHIFHHDCLMQWMKKEHNDCPTCRQPLWDVETFQTLAREYGGQAENLEAIMSVATGQRQPSQPSTVARRPERAGFPWARACQILNAVCFTVGITYIIASILQRRNEN